MDETAGFLQAQEGGASEDRGGPGRAGPTPTMLRGGWGQRKQRLRSRA